MDQFGADVTDILGVKVYEGVVLIGRSGEKVFAVDNMVQILGTIGYEVIL